MIVNSSNTKEMISSIKLKNKLMLEERNSFSDDSVSHPSGIWSDSTGYLRFISDLTYEHLLNLRLHTGFLTGTVWYKHAHQPYRFWEDEVKKETIRIISAYKDLTEEIPEQYWADEPVTTPILEALGVRYKNRLITDDLTRYQRCMTNVYTSGIFSFLETCQHKPTILEIGGGYGSLAHQISACIGIPCSYIIIDLPEVLQWSAIYLAINNPQKKLYFYDADSFRDDFFQQEYSQFDFILIPNYKIGALDRLRSMNLMLNLLSFQEMSEEQISNYAKLGNEKLNGYLYSENFTRHWMNKELNTTVDDVLDRYFRLFPDPKIYKKIVPSPNNPDNPRMLWKVFPYIGLNRNNELSLKPKVDVFYTPYGRFSYSTGRLRRRKGIKYRIQNVLKRR